MTELAAEPRRLTPSERQHEVVMALAQRVPVPPEHSIETSRNAKGAPQFNATVRGYDLDEVLAQALATYAALDAALPYPENGA